MCLVATVLSSTGKEAVSIMVSSLISAIFIKHLLDGNTFFRPWGHQEALVNSRPGETLTVLQRDRQDPITH